MKTKEPKLESVQSRPTAQSGNQLKPKSEHFFVALAAL
jgi:hypothetical protein